MEDSEKKSSLFLLPQKDQMQIVFKDLSFSVKIKGKKESRFERAKTFDKEILKGVTGVFQPGRLTAVMGASGAGKTSLLQVLAGEARQGTVMGSILVNGEDVRGNIKKISGFVFQDDVILATMTSREAIMMSALLRLPREMSLADKETKVDDMIKLLSLEKAAKTIIGSTVNKGISGGERKRVAMAMEMITDPSLLFLDEPTSGLDTFTAYSVVNTLKNLASTGRTVITTIHQPSSEVFQLFDDLILMADGRIIYSGPADEAVNYFVKFGYECPEYTNPADYLFMSILNNEEGFVATTKDGPTTNLSNAQRMNALLDAWQVSPENAAVKVLSESPKQGGLASIKKVQTSTMMEQGKYLLGRTWRNATRNPLVIKAKFGQSIIIAIIIGVLFLGTGSNYGYAGAQNRNGMLFFAVINNVMSATISVLSIFGEEKSVFMREFGSGYYKLPPYFASKILVEFPFQIIAPWVFCTIVYWMVGLQDFAEKYFLFVLFVVLSSCSGFALGIAIASFFESLETALSTAPLILMPLMLFSGLFVNNGAIPPYFNWIKYVSPMKYAFEGLVKNEYTGLQIACLSTSNATVDGSQCISQLGMDDNLPILNCAVVLLSMVVILMFLAYLALLRIVLMRGKAVEPQKRKEE